jgi:hypothetical protein
MALARSYRASLSDLTGAAAVRRAETPIENQKLESLYRCLSASIGG